MNRITLKKLFPFVVLFLVVMLFSVEARAEKRIGVLLWSEEGRYIETKNGILDQLKKDGFGEPAVKYTIENAGESNMKASKQVQEFVAAKMNLIITIGTSAAIPVAKAIKDVPIVFSNVYDPVEAGIAKDWKSSGNNVTGVSPKIPMSKLMDSLKEITPVKMLAVLYTPGEKNSEIQLLELQKLQTNPRIQVFPVILSKKEEVAYTLSEVVRVVDAVYLTGSSVVGANVPVIVNMANKAKVVTVTHLDDLVEKGALLGVCVNSYQAGRLAGEKAVKILRGAKPSAIPIETLKKFDVILNMKTAKAGQFRIPPEFMKNVTKKIE